MEDLTETDIAAYAGCFRCPTSLNLSNCKLNKDTVMNLMKLNVGESNGQFNSTPKESPYIMLKSSDGSNFCLNVDQ